MVVYISSPPAAPAVELPIRTACQHTLIGWDGSEWDLTGGGNGVQLMAGSRGWNNAPIIRHTSKSAGRAGSRNRGQVTDERDIFWALKVATQGSSQDWLDLNERIWRVLDEDQLNTWRITRPDGTFLDLQVRYTALDDDGDDTDPALLCKAFYGTHMVAEQPYWVGKPKTRTFTNPSGEDYYGGADGGGYGPPFVTGAGYTTDIAAITNAAHVPAMPIWQVNGPSTSATVGVDGHLVSFPMAIPDGGWVRLDTDDTDQVAVDQDGNDRTDELGLVDFASIPVGVEVPLSVSITGAGSVTVTVPQLFKRGE